MGSLRRSNIPRLSSLVIDLALVGPFDPNNTIRLTKAKTKTKNKNKKIEAEETKEVDRPSTINAMPNSGGCK
jgi:hypothetical protein